MKHVCYSTRAEAKAAQARKGGRIVIATLGLKRKKKSYCLVPKSVKHDALWIGQRMRTGVKTGLARRR